MNTLKDIAKLLVVRPYYRLRGASMGIQILNVSRRRLFASNRPRLSPIQARIVSDLKRDGIALTTMKELFGGETLFGDLVSYLGKLEATAQPSQKKSFFIDLWDTRVVPFDLQNPMLKIALDPRVLAIANSYLGMFSRLFGIRAMRTVVMGEADKPTQSQLWHRDPDDRKICKIFIYGNDVDQGTGPFSYIRGSHYSGPYWDVFPQLLPGEAGSGRFSDADAASKIPEENILVCTGKAGTVIFADTAGLHKGGYSIRQSRLMSLATFMSGVPFTRPSRRRKIVYPADMERQIREFPLEARMALRRPSIEVP